MKRILVLIGTLLLMLNVSAQSTKLQGSTNLRIILHPIMEITVLQDEVTLEYKTMVDYKEGVSKMKWSHVLINSTSDFLVTVRSDKDYNAGNITLVVSSDTYEAFPKNDIQLTTNDKNFFRGGRGHNLYYNVNYKGDKDYKYFNYIDGNESKEYSTLVIYTIAPQ